MKQEISEAQRKSGILTGAVIGLGAIGVTLTYSILGFANFAHGELISFGAYATLLP